MIIHEDCLKVMKEMEDNSIDFVVTDPPYGLNFMNKKWDYNVPFIEIWEEALRICKPGAMMASFGGSRTHHHLMMAIESAKWEIRDVIMWIYGSGFPKSHNISKGIDKQGGSTCHWFGKWLREEREKRNIKQNEISSLFPSKSGGLTGCVANWELGLNIPSPEQFNKICDYLNVDFERRKECEREIIGKGISGTTAIWQDGGMGDFFITKASSDLSKTFEGYGTALKPAYEPIIIAMKPLDGTFAQNAEKWGVAGINIDSSRIGTSFDMNPNDFDDSKRNSPKFSGKYNNGNIGEYRERKGEVPNGRWPSNLILSPESAEQLDQQTGNNVSRFFKTVESEYNCSLCSCVTTLKHDIMNEKGMSCETVNIAKNHLLHPIPTKNKDFVVPPVQQNSQQEIEDKKESSNLNVHAANQYLKTLPEINQNSVQSIVLTNLEESIFHHVKLAENVCDLCAGNIAQGLVKIKNLDFKIEELQATLGYIGNFKKCILIQNLVLFAEQWENIDIIPTTQSLSKLFGCVLHAIESYTNQESPNQNGKSEQSRFRYCPKASSSERNKGLEGMPLKAAFDNENGSMGGNMGSKSSPRQNSHPTVKPISLMKYIITLLAPPGNPICLDPFMGSGSTGVACKELGIDFIGIEKESEYCEIAKARIG